MKTPPKIKIYQNVVFYAAYLMFTALALYAPTPISRGVGYLVVSVMISFTCLAAVICMIQSWNIEVRTNVAKMMQDPKFEVSLLIARVGALATIALMLYGEMHFVILTLYVAATVGTELNYRWNLNWQETNKGSDFE